MADAILRLPDLSRKFRLSRSTIYDRLDPKSPRHDPTFPKPVRLGDRAIGFLQSEAESWLSSRVEASRKGAP
ncbi:MAG: helix-turn-helix transcriptional regulator [Burkholderiales bacterium]